MVLLPWFCPCVIVLVTFDVQDVTATYMYTSEQDGYGDILVTCVFARGTRALGCIVVFRNGLTTRNMTIMKSEEHSTTEASGVMYHLPDGEYEVTAYDLEFDNTSDTDCEPVSKIFTFPPTTIPPSSSSTPSTLLPSNSPPIVGAFVHVHVHSPYFKLVLDNQS